MSFSDLSFLFGAFPIFIIVFYVSKEKFRPFILLLFSIWFYYVNDSNSVAIMLGVIVTNYLFGILIDKTTNKNLRSLVLLIGVASNILFFIYRRYYYQIFRNAVMDEIHPIVMLVGQSFFTFSIISYLVDIYRGKIKSELNIIHFANYVIMFPKIIMGPIVRYADVKEDLHTLNVTREDLNYGIRRFVFGFSKKVIIADNLALLVSEVTSVDSIENTVFSLWISSIAYSLELYLDFSGYSDMAIGLSKMIGIGIKENFDHPYMCKTFTDFWRRWHISLSGFFRDYVYIPLGGSRKGIARHVLNLMIVWLLTGLWHGKGWNFIAWGLIYFAVLVIEKYIVKPSERNKLIQFIYRIFTLLIVNLNWVMFSIGSFRFGFKYICRMFVILPSSGTFGVEDIRYLREYGIYFVIAIIFAMPVRELIYNKFKIQNKVIIECIGLVFLMIVSISYIMIGFQKPFLYQQF